MKRLILLSLALLVSMNFAFAWSLCVTDQCRDNVPTDGTVVLMPPDDVSTFFVRYNTCAQCQVYATCEVNGQLAWSRTYNGTGTDVIRNPLPGYTVRLKIVCQPIPLLPVICPPTCEATVKIGNPVNFQCP